MLKIVVAYICVANGKKTTDFAARFASTYHDFPGGYAHDLLVICNGGPITTEQSMLFNGSGALFWPRQNVGWDIGGYIEAAKGPCADYDMMVCCGESIYFHSSGWLMRLAESWQKYGPGMYGSFSSNLVRGHLNTTGFCCAPHMLRRYPRRIEGKKDRYEFEHGTNSFWRFLSHAAIPVKMVTWDGEYGPHHWREPRNILWRGDQSACLMFCSHTDRYAKADQATKQKWAKGADREFK